MAGRPALSDQEHALKGTERRCRVPNVISLATTAGRPTCPRSLSKAAKKEWRAIVNLLESRSVLDPGAGPTLELYANIRARYLKAMADVDKNGEQIMQTKSTSKGELYTVLVENPYLKIATECEAQLMQLTKTLGIA